MPDITYKSAGFTVAQFNALFAASSHTNLLNIGTNTHATIDLALTALASHIISMGNPHSVTKSQVGLGSVENTALSTWAGSTAITTIGTISTGSIPWANVVKTVSDIADIATRSHTSLTDIGSSSHATIDSHLGNTSNPHSVTAAQVGALTDIVQDTTPQLGGNLDLNSKNIVNSETNGPIVLTPTGTGSIKTDRTNNARGAYSIDLQLLRSNVNQVASGANSTLIGGAYCRAAAAYSTIVGSFDSYITQSYAAIVGGRYNYITNYTSTIIAADTSYVTGAASVIAGADGAHVIGNFSAVIASFYSTIGNSSYCAVIATYYCTVDPGVEACFVTGYKNRISHLNCIAMGGGARTTARGDIVVGGVFTGEPTPSISYVGYRYTAGAILHVGRAIDQTAVVTQVTFTFTDASVNTSTEVITISAHGLTEGDRIQLTSTGTLPAGLALLTDYYVIWVSTTTIKLASTLALCHAGTPVDITAAAGGGTHTVTVYPENTIKLHTVKASGQSKYVGFRASPTLAASVVYTHGADGSANALQATDGAGNVSWTLTPTVTTLTATDGLVVPKTSGKGIKVDAAAPTFGYKDLIGDIHAKTTGATAPGFVAYRGAHFAYEFHVGDVCYLMFHIPHDLVPGSNLFIHAHWSHIETGVTSGGVTWQFDVSSAKGYDRGAFSATVSPTIQQNASTTRYQHMLAEVQLSATTPSATQLDSDDIEIDGLLMVTCSLIGHNIDVGNSVFLHYVDIHYQTNGVLGTKDKNYPFFT